MCIAVYRAELEILQRLERISVSMNQTYNGMPASQLRGVSWRKSEHSNPNGSCVEVAGLADGEVAVRNSRDPAGPTLIYPPAVVAAFLRGAKEGQFDCLTG